MDEKRLRDIESFIGEQIPEELRLNIEEVTGRVVFPLKPTTVSATSTRAYTPDEIDPTDDGIDKEIDDLIDGVVALEDKVEQIEDLIDQHIKDMAIPAINDNVKKAVNKITPDTNGIITADTFKNSKAILDNLAILNTGQDFVLGALTGNGALDGDWMQCSDVTKDIAKNFKAASEKDYGNIDIPVQEQSMNVMENHNKSILRMLLDLILKLFWNMLWPKFIVDLIIINPIRMVIAYPIDGLIGFFTKWGDIRRFKKKPKPVLEQYGPINKALNKLRIFLICKLPPKAYDAYDPIVEIDCPGPDEACIEPEKTQDSFNPKEDDKDSTLGDVGSVFDAAADSMDECPDEEVLTRNANLDQPEGLGLSTECAEAAKLILEAVMNDALTASGPNDAPWLKTYDNIINGSEG